MSAVANWNHGFDIATGDAAGMLEAASVEHGHGAVEGYLRRSTLVKLEFDAATGETRSKVGREEGGALRWLDPRDGTSGFAAATGDASRSLARCRAIGLETPGQPLAGCPWNGSAEPVRDLDPAAALPEIEELATWLRETAPAGLDHAWIEAGTVAEAWLDGSENVQQRRRNRAWACWTPREDPPAVRPMILAARGWPELARLDPREPWRRRRVEGPAEHPWPDDACWVFSPETSAFLVQLLARVAHSPGAAPGASVGSGWVLAAGAPKGLYAVASDDAGFPAAERTLADGRQVLGSWGGPGTLRRASFRDLPETAPVNLVLSPPRLDPPKRAIWITRAEIHPSGDAWSIRLSGRRYPDGAGFRPCWKRIRPHALLTACLGGVGPARESHLGVVTPALVFDGLLLG